MLLNRIKTLLIWLVIAVFINAEDSTLVAVTSDFGFTYGFENDVVTQYIWHGIGYNEGLLIQPSPWISFGDLSFCVWGSFTLYDVNSEEKNNEIDFISEYFFQTGEFFITPSISYYTYPGKEDMPSTAEASLKLAYNIQSFEFYINPTYDFLEYSGSLFFEFGTASEWEMNDKLAFMADINCGMANREFNQINISPEISNTTFNYLSLSVAANYYLAETIYLKPHIEYYKIFGKELIDITGNNLFNLGLLLGTEL